jgi:aryl-alcohol dehydrogenase-like predicted oxidoreductase
MRLGLGTAQFGLDYGVSNRRGRVRIAEVRKIFEVAESAGISLLDTAPSYGDSEASIGAALEPAAEFRIVTKTPVFTSDTIGAADAQALSESFDASRKALRRETLYGLLFHHADDVLKPGGKRLVDAAQDLVESGAVEKIGVSVYTGSEIDRILDVFAPGIVQAPANVFDQRLVRSGYLARLEQLGVELHVRSVFLQGLLLMDADRMPAYFGSFQPRLRRYFDAVAAAGSSKVEAALGFAMSLPADAVLVGVSSVGELRELVRSSDSRAQRIDYDAFAIDDPRLVDPSRWKLQ